VKCASATPEEAGGDFDPILDNLTDRDDFVEPNRDAVYDE
jgi:hypothetical protein